MLEKKVFTGIKWSGVSQIVRQAVQLLTTFLLVKLLLPTDFGLMAMSVIVIGFLEIFKDLGTSSALIQQKTTSENLLSSVFWVNTLFGMTITIVIFFLAPVISEFYEEPRIIPILQALSFTFIISSVTIVHKALLERTIDFNLLAKTEMFTSIISSVMAIVAAFLGFGVWSLVLQAVVNALSNTVLLWVSSGWKPKFIFRMNEIKLVLNYSINLLGFHILNFAVRNADYLLIGKFLGDKPLGHYYLAYRIMLYPLYNITWVISRVLFPVYSKLQDDNEGFRKTYISVSKAIAIITFPMMLGMMGVSEHFVKVFFGRQWDYNTLVILLLIFSPLGLIQSISSTTGLIYQSKGRTDLMFKWSGAVCLIFISAFFIGLRWGVIGVASSYLIAYLLITYHGFAIPFKLIDLNFTAFVKNFVKIIVAGLTMLATIIIINVLLNGFFSNAWMLVLLILLGIVVYIAINLLINKEDFVLIKKILKENFA